MKVYVASVSGGKDSTATCLHLRELGIPFRAVHFDTGWEHAATVEYVRDTLPRVLGQPVEVARREPRQLDERREAWAVEIEGMLGFRSPMARWTLSRQMFPTSGARFCTQEMKIYTARDVMRAVHAAGDLPVNVVGIRAAESAARAELDEHELSTTLDCMVWRPLIRWTEDEVIAIHRRHNVPPNPLYLRGASRVGCFPCIKANKAGVRMLDEARVRVIERLEEMVSSLRGERGVAPAHFFARRDGERAPGEPHGEPIRARVAWAQTMRGGKELEREQLTLGGMDDGCLRWGMCETRSTDGGA